MPITGDLSSREVSRVTHSDADSYAVPLVPLESVEMGAVHSLMEHTRVCRAIPGLARIDGNPPFQLQQSFPLQYQTGVQYAAQPAVDAWQQRAWQGNH